MPNEEKLLWCTYADVLIPLFLMSSMDLIIKEKKVEILPISVIIEDASDDYYVNFKKGMEMAAEEFHGGVSLITLYVTNDQGQQMELIQREMRDGAKATILSPVNEAEAVMVLDAMSLNCPIILLEAPVPNESVVDAIAANNFEMGQMAARAVTAQAPSDVPAYLFIEGLSYEDNTNVYGGVGPVLDDRGFICRLVEKRTDNTYRQAIEETVYPGDRRITIIALGIQSLDEANRVVDGGTVYQVYAIGLYGVGSTTSILGGLDKGIVDGFIAYDQLDIGYPSVKRMVEVTQDSRRRKQTQLDVVCVSKENIWGKQHGKMFYPIE